MRASVVGMGICLGLLSVVSGCLPAPPPKAEAPGSAVRAPPRSGCGKAHARLTDSFWGNRMGDSFAPCGPSLEVPRLDEDGDTYGFAEVPVGTPIAASAGGPAWAHVTRSFRARALRSARTGAVRLLSIPGIEEGVEGTLRHAVVAAGSVQFEAGK